MMRETVLAVVVSGEQGRAPAGRKSEAGALPYVEHLLSAWGAWARRQAHGAVGFPTCSPMFKDMPVGKCYDSRLPLGIGSGDCAETDRAVARLDAESRRLCVEVYQIGGPTTAIAVRLGWHRQRVPERLRRVHHELLGHMNDLAAGC